MQSVYLDHAATTPVREEVFAAMVPYLTEKFGNPSSLHALGREARRDIEEARGRIARELNASPQEILFTSGGTEADNIAIFGAVAGNKKPGKHLVTSAIEHHGVLHPFQALESRGYRLTVLPVDKYGLVDPGELEKVLSPETILVSIMQANNEVGTIQPIQELATLTRAAGALFHTDAVQSLGILPIDLQELPVDLLSASGHKLYGPKGIGFLYRRKGTKLGPTAFGGAQENSLRPGTENVAGIIGLARAVELAVAEQAETSKRLIYLRDKLIAGLTALPQVTLNGHPRLRLPGNVNVSVSRVEGESLILRLDLKGIAVSSGSACTSGALDPSHVLLAMGLNHQAAHGSLRLTLGRSTTEADIDYVLQVAPGIIEGLRQMSPIVD